MKKRERLKAKRGISLFLSMILVLMVFFPYLPPVEAKAAEDYGNQVTLTSAHGDIGKDHKLYCIDKGGLAIWGIADDGDVYEAHKPSEAEVPLSKKEQEYIFFGILTLQASIGIKESNDIIDIVSYFFIVGCVLFNICNFILSTTLPGCPRRCPGRCSLTGRTAPAAAEMGKQFQ